MQDAFISVIVPVYNNCECLRKCLQALTAQTYKEDLYEVIVVDNNSTEDIQSVVDLFGAVKIIFEPKSGSYAARNRGLAVAKGEILAFIDSDCLPVNEWIEQGIKAIDKYSADLLGGEVVFNFSSQKTAAEIYDSVTNMQIKRDIETRKISKTANLFVRREVFDEIGLFPEEFRSGGDVFWTKKATSAGFLLAYSPDAKVFHPARKLSELIRKQYRVGKGQPSIWLDEGQSLTAITINCVKSLKPPKLSKLLSQLESEQRPEVETRGFSIFMVIWVCNIAMVFGRLDSVLKLAVLR